MDVIYGLDAARAAKPEPSAVAIGVFDGVHWGHRAIFEKVVEAARSLALVPSVLTFDKHPAELLAPTRAPHYINTLDQRIELIASTGASRIVIADFNPALANLPAVDFVSDILIATLNAKVVVVGSNFRFGKDRSGDVRTLADIAPKSGIAVEVVSAVIINDGPASSTRIRALISHGDMPGAANLLGKRFTLRGTVVQGRQIGRTLGFPTANIQTYPRQALPAKGVYMVEVAADGSVYSGVCNVGNRPTFGPGELSIEVHLSGYKGDLYGRQLDVVFCRKLRDEMLFESTDHLVEQIQTDLRRAQEKC